MNTSGNPIELLAPAGNLSRLKTAFHFGADAVYLGGKDFGLRSQSGNFTEEELKEAVHLSCTLGKKVYVTVNIFAKNADFPAIKSYALFLQDIGIDAVIVSDIGVLKLFRDTNLEIHVSTQANVCNKYTAMQYVEMGARRIILARELHITEIAEICEHLKNNAEVEVFVHGSMCISYSGRCLLSNYMTGRESNRGDCAQGCRYKYALQEEKRPNEFFPIEEDENGTYIMNSRDLCLINHLRDLADAGVKSFKIEGRMKNEHYVGTVANAYRRVLDGEKFDYMSELEKVSHRPFTTGFTFAAHDTEFLPSSSQIQTHEIVGVCIGSSDILVKNKLKAGDEIEILSPDQNNGKIFIFEGETANVPETIVKIDCPYKLNANDILRKKVNRKRGLHCSP